MRREPDADPFAVTGDVAGRRRRFFFVESFEVSLGIVHGARLGFGVRLLLRRALGRDDLVRRRRVRNGRLSEREGRHTQGERTARHAENDSRRPHRRLR
jgi:hypothetical protein